jgi:hypothetical protein
MKNTPIAYKVLSTLGSSPILNEVVTNNVRIIVGVMMSI